MIKCGDFVRVMNVSKTDQVLVGTVTALKKEIVPFVVVTRVRVQPAFGESQWVDEQACEVLRQSDL